MMFKFKMNNDIMDISIEMPLINDDSINAVTNLIRAISSNTLNNKQPIIANKTNTIMPESIDSYNEVTVTSEENKPIIRDRLPNSDKLNIQDLKQVSSKTTAHYNFMCPHCYQSMSILINNNLIIKDPFSNDNSELYMLEDSYKPINNHEMYKLLPEELGMRVCEEDIAILANESLYGTCINCHCTEATTEWINTYNNKTDITGNDNICMVCGSEMLYNVDQNGNSCLTCENESCKNIITQKK